VPVGSKQTSVNISLICLLKSYILNLLQDKLIHTGLLWAVPRDVFHKYSFVRKEVTVVLYFFVFPLLFTSIAVVIRILQNRTGTCCTIYTDCWTSQGSYVL